MTILIALALFPLFVLTSAFAIEVGMGLWPIRLPDAPSMNAGSTIIVVPAHDEAALLEERLAVLIKAAKGRAKILLVADNCTDDTAEIARRFGIETIERNDPHRRGKGFALDYARQHLRRDPPDVMLIMDADCITDSPSIDRLVARCVATGRPCQAAYLQRPAREASPAVQLSTFAFYVKNVVRQRGLQRLAGCVNLVGTGMALPWNLAAIADLATGSIVEDLQLGQELARAGHPPVLVEGAVVWGRAETDANTLSQRRRWEGGFLQNASRVAPRMLLGSAVRGDIRGLIQAIDLMIPPFALLIMVDSAALFAATLILLWTGAPLWPVELLGASLGLAAVALLVAWALGGARFVSLSGLAKTPLYVLWKLPLYLGFARRGAPKEWIRTDRIE